MTIQFHLRGMNLKAEALADGVRALSTLIHALRTALVGAGSRRMVVAAA